MTYGSWRAFAAAIAIVALVLSSPGAAQSQGARFAAPKLLKAGNDHLGKGRLYPSPVFHDVNGDGLGDIVIGDLFGKVTVAHQLPGEAVTFGPEKPMLMGNGKPLKFHNW